MYYNIVTYHRIFFNQLSIFGFSLILIYFLVVITGSNHNYTSHHIHSKPCRRITYVL